MPTTTNRRQLFSVLIRLRRAYGATSVRLRRAYGATSVRLRKAYGATSVRLRRAYGTTSFRLLPRLRDYGATSSAFARLRILLILLQASLFAGCEQKRVPSIDVFGSYFPAWLISLLVGVILTIVAGALGHLFNFRPNGFLAFLLNVSLILIFSISVWFWFFAG